MLRNNTFSFPKINRLSFFNFPLLKSILILVTICLTWSCKNTRELTPAYLNPDNPTEKRVDDLLSRMTLEEKVGQMNQYAGPERVQEWFDRRGLNTGDNQSEVYTPIAGIEEMVRTGEIGSFLFVSGAEESNRLQKLAKESRLKIPLFIAIDAIHGHAMLPSGATVYPTNIGLSCSWDTILASRIARATAVEMAVTGFNWTFFPVTDILRDPRWGRTGETFGEDPLLVSLFSDVFVRGFQENNPPIMACTKAFIGHNQPLNGLNFAPADISERTLREVFLPPVISNIKEGVGSVMAAHNEVNGIPVHSNHYLLTDLLKNELGFSGIIISDWLDIFALHSVHKVAKDNKEAIKMAINAGIDIHMHGPGFIEPLIELVNEGQVEISRIDDAVRRILRAKFEYGLFERPYADEVNWEKGIKTPEHRYLALHAAEEAIVLLKNDGNLLPLSTDIKSVFITGPNANNHALLGDWSLDQSPEDVTTILEGIKSIAPSKLKIDYFDCGDITEIDEKSIAIAEKNAKKSDIAIVVVGGDALRVKGNVRSYGENIDRASINLVGNQLELVKAIYKTGKPVVVIFVTGRPTSEPWIAENIPSVLYAWEPGMEGGQAVANILFGKINPSAKLTVSFPRSAGHIPAYYNHKPAMYYRSYKLEETSNLYDFGFGLSYTKFLLSDPVISKETMGREDSLIVSVRVKNVGVISGKEIVQLYIRDDYSTVTRPVKELKAFKKIELEPGEEKIVDFIIYPSMLAFFDTDMNLTMEKGEFTVMTGNSSRDSDLRSVKFNLDL